MAVPSAPTTTHTFFIVRDALGIGQVGQVAVLRGVPGVGIQLWAVQLKQQLFGLLVEPHPEPDVQLLAHLFGDAEQAAVLFDQSEQDALDAIVDGSRTNTKQVVIESIVANVPGLPVNPVSVMLGLRDAVRSYKKNSHHGWLYLLRDIRKSVPKSQDAQA